MQMLSILFSLWLIHIQTRVGCFNKFIWVFAQCTPKFPSRRQPRSPGAQKSDTLSTLIAALCKLSQDRQLQKGRGSNKWMESSARSPHFWWRIIAARPWGRLYLPVSICRLSLAQLTRGCRFRYISPPTQSSSERGKFAFHNCISLNRILLTH